MNKTEQIDLVKGWLHSGLSRWDCERRIIMDGLSRKDCDELLEAARTDLGYTICEKCHDYTEKIHPVDDEDVLVQSDEYSWGTSTKPVVRHICSMCVRG